LGPQNAKLSDDRNSLPFHCHRKDSGAIEVTAEWADDDDGDGGDAQLAWAVNLSLAGKNSPRADRVLTRLRGNWHAQASYAGTDCGGGALP